MRPISSHALYLDLLQDLGLSDGVDLKPYPWDSLSIATRKSLARSFVKKFADDADQLACDKVALDKFLSVNERCGTWQLECENLLDHLLVSTLKKYLHEFFHITMEVNGKVRSQMPLVHSFSSILDEGRVGPGASVGSESTDFYTKMFDSKLSCTSTGLRRAYSNYVQLYPLWREAEETRRSAWGEASIVEGNRLRFVPKDATTSRSICVEPSLNMFYQLGLGRIIESRLKSYFKIDLDRQPDINRTLARHGSQDGSLVTIDLSSASDSMSLRMLREFLPQSIMQWLEILRSPSSETSAGRVVLNMVSTMGNGFTFPLQTALFSCIVAAAFSVDDHIRYDTTMCYIWDRRPRISGLPNWSVFGDDIICPERIARKVLRLLKLTGFEVNSDKTYTEKYGSFRESCGFDYLSGVNVRGVFCKTLREPQDRYTLINLLNAWSSRTGITVPLTMRRLLRSVPQIVVPPWENADCGVWMPERLLYLFKHNLRRSKNGSYLYKRYVPKPVAMLIREDKIHVPRRKKPRRYNPAGLYLAFLSGYITNGKILVRSDKVRYVTKWAVAPNWSYHPTVQGPFKGPVGDPGLNTPEVINLITAW